MHARRRKLRPRPRPSTDDDQSRARSRRPSAALLVAGLLFALVAVGPIGAADVTDLVEPDPGPTVDLGTLAVGEHVFWTIELDAPSGAPVLYFDGVSGTTGCRGAQCFVYTLELTEPGEQLRVALDMPGRFDSWSFDVRDPTGASRGLAFIGGGTGVAGGLASYSGEAFVADAEAGQWTIVVEADDAVPGFARMRAKLQSAPDPVASILYLPNLRSAIPSELTFTLPATSFAYGVEGTGVSCTPYEQAVEGAVRCLRMSTGPDNVGQGPVDLHLAPVGEGALQVPVTQRIYRGDGTFDEHETGTATYHETHMHYHFDETNTLELWRVTDGETGAMEQVGPGNKNGFCMGPYRIASWYVFADDHVGLQEETGCFLVWTPTGARMSLNPGWADIYSYQVDSNYIEFSQAGDGVYVVRSIVDGNDLVIESDEADNVAFVHFAVTGDEIEVFERGYGRDPWDPDKVVDNASGDPLACRRGCVSVGLSE